MKAVDALQRADFAALQVELSNDFHDVILAAFPEVARTAKALERAGARGVLLSGSGSSVFALFESESAAAEVAARIDSAACAQLLRVPFHHDPAWR